MTNQQGAPEALRPIARYKIGYATDGWGMRSSTPSGIPHHAGAWVRYEDHVAALVEAQQPAPSAAAAEPDKADPRKLQLQGLILSLARLSCVPPMAPALEHQLERLAAFYFENGDEKFAQKLVMLRRGAFANGRRSVLVPSAAPTPQADSQPAPVLDERAARDECKRRWLAEDEDCNLLEAYDRGWKDRAASAPADSVTAPAGESRCANCGKSAADSRERIADYPEEGEWFCSAQCKDQHDELDCPHLTHNGYRHPAESERLIACEGVLRSLASWLGVGGFNAPTVDAKVFEEKIRWGIEHLLQATQPAQAADSVLEDAALSQAARDVLAERQRQISAEGWTPEHDDEQHLPGELALAAASYVCADENDAPPAIWPWALNWWKPRDRRRNLTKAGALILAELERIDRAARKQGGA